MRISVVADVHGNYDALARIAEHAEQLVVLGDLLDYVDYHDPRRGVIGEIFGEQAAGRFAQLRAAGAFVKLREFNAGLWRTLADPEGVLSDLVQQRYRRVLEIIGPDAVVTLGNVDVAEEWNRVAGAITPYRDAEVLRIGGLRLGFVAGGATRYARSERVAQMTWRPFVRPMQEYRDAVGVLGDVDVLCTHIPPDIPLLRYDIVPARLEMAGPGLIDYIDAHQPALTLFGHVHQPLASRARRGVTECLNVGHFQRTATAFVLDTDAVIDRSPSRSLAGRSAGR